MKLIIPMAGKGTRLRPHTHTTNKSLVHVAGKPLIAHILDSLSDLKIDEAIFILDKEQPELVELIENNYKFKGTYIQQKEQKGNGHAIFGAKKYATGDDVFIIFGDTLVEANLKKIDKDNEEGIIWTKKVDDPSSYGVVFEQDNKITRLIEKPETPISDKAIIGMYYFNNSKKLFNALEHIIKNDIKSKGEYMLTDAIQIMIDKGDKFVSREVQRWVDTGTVPRLINTNKYLLEKSKQKTEPTKNSIIIKPVFIEKGAKIENSIIGPNVSIGKQAKINNAVISDTIVNKEAIISDAVLKQCVIGKNAKVKGNAKKLNIGDGSEIHYSD